MEPQNLCRVRLPALLAWPERFTTRDVRGRLFEPDQCGRSLGMTDVHKWNYLWNRWNIRWLQVEFRWCHPGMLWSVGVCGWTIFVTSAYFLQFVEKYRSENDVNLFTQARNFSGVMFYLHCSAMFGIFLLRSPRIPHFLEAWRRTLAALGHHGRDLTLKR